MLIPFLPHHVECPISQVWSCCRAFAAPPPWPGAIPLFFLIQVLSTVCFSATPVPPIFESLLYSPAAGAGLLPVGRCNFVVRRRLNVGIVLFISSQLLIIELLLPTCQAVQLLAACWILKFAEFGSHPVQGPRSTVHSPLSGPGSVVQGPLSRWQQNSRKQLFKISRSLWRNT